MGGPAQPITLSGASTCRLGFSQHGGQDREGNVPKACVRRVRWKLQGSPDLLSEITQHLFCCILLTKSKSLSVQIQGRGPHMGMNPRSHAGSHFWKQATPVPWQAHTSPEPGLKHFLFHFCPPWVARRVLLNKLLLH